jgi:hypothetical protein
MVQEIIDAAAKEEEDLIMMNQLIDVTKTHPVEVVWKELSKQGHASWVRIMRKKV